MLKPIVRVFRFIRDWYWRRQREIDLGILWPTCKKYAPDLNSARAAFAAHAFHDPAWIRFYGEKRLVEIISTLE